MACILGKGRVLWPVGCGEHSEAHRSRLMRLLTSVATSASRWPLWVEFSQSMSIKLELIFETVRSSPKFYTLVSFLSVQRQTNAVLHFFTIKIRAYPQNRQQRPAYHPDKPRYRLLSTVECRLPETAFSGHDALYARQTNFFPALRAFTTIVAFCHCSRHIPSMTTHKTRFDDQTPLSMLPRRPDNVLHYFRRDLFQAIQLIR